MISQALLRLSFEFKVSISCPIRILHYIGLLHLTQYLTHFQNSLLLDCYADISRAFRTLSLDCYASILRIFRILFHQIVTYLSRTLLIFSLFELSRQSASISCIFLGFSFIRLTFVSHTFLEFSLMRLLRWYLTHLQDSLSLGCYVSTLLTFRIFLYWVVTLAPHSLLGFSFLGLCQYLTHFWDSLSLDRYVSISRTFKILFYWIVT